MSFKQLSAVNILLFINISLFILTLMTGLSHVSLIELLLVGNKSWLSTLGMSHSNPIYTVLTANFMHAGVIHLTLNMLAFKDMGKLLESRLGFKYFMISYLLLCVVVMLGSYVYYANTTLPVVGASGAICGMLSMIATLAFYQNKMFGNNEVLTRVRKVSLLNLGIMTMLSSLPFVAGFSHIFGMILGFVFAQFFLKKYPHYQYF